MAVLDKVKKIIAQTLNVDEAAIYDTLSIGGIEQWDSMGNMAIIAALEENLGLEFPIEDLFELNSVNSIVAEIEKMKK